MRRIPRTSPSTTSRRRRNAASPPPPPSAPQPAPAPSFAWPHHLLRYCDGMNIFGKIITVVPFRSDLLEVKRLPLDHPASFGGKGFGVFARCPIAAQTVLGEYGGTFFPAGTEPNDYEDRQYQIQVGGGTISAFREGNEVPPSFTSLLSFLPPLPRHRVLQQRRHLGEIL